MLFASIENSSNLIGGILKTPSITRLGEETLSSFKRVYEKLSLLKLKLKKKETEEEIERG